MGVKLVSTSGGSVEVNPPATASNFTQTLVPITGTLAPLVSGTAVASTSGTSIDFTDIPSWVKRITVMFNGVSTNGSSVPIVQLGDSGGVETSGYTGVSSELYTTISTVANPASGFGIQGGMSAALLLTGNLTIALQGSNIWVATGAFYRVGATNMTVISCGKTLSGTLDRVRITTFAGTDTFDAGSINILYE
jgi:hypothetical protein